MAKLPTEKRIDIIFNLLTAENWWGKSFISDVLDTFEGPVIDINSYSVAKAKENKNQCWMEICKNQIPK